MLRKLATQRESPKTHGRLSLARYSRSACSLASRESWSELKGKRGGVRHSHFHLYVGSGFRISRRKNSQIDNHQTLVGNCNRVRLSYQFEWRRAIKVNLARVELESSIY